ncbi:tRNA (N6-isopentenyl adenosine(37)-C2)-methylthiotransferase MiaB [Myceligenerans crystallogenes]|uniref:tRNA-2-methylthio-N(6)-dimethylallyladenosine synthase n=1 Tax=Myceligenerans crystallogenes TaxID=316335 RepID=A0ABP4ZUP5_9MICO
MSTPTIPAPVPASPDAGTPDAAEARRTYMVRTLGCQMNVHDSEHMAGMLEQAGYTRASGEDEAASRADVVVINTCAVRENAATRLYGNLGQLASLKARRPGMQIAVGGCLAQKDRGTIVEKAPWVDVVFGTHNLDALPVLLERARHNEAAEVEIAESLQVFPSTLPTRRESVYAGWVSISVGCNNTCTFCIVPHLRGKERDRRPGEILAEVEALVAAGAVEVTLLGQNVNSYGVEFGDRGAFAKLLRACGRIEGLERVRFTSPHPAAFTDDVIEAMAQTPNVMPQLHMPLQSGSDRILRAMRRSYRSEKFLGILDRVRAAMPDAAITTDIIVGFPGETEEDFAETLRVVEAARFSSAFMFQYSKRPGTPAATMDGQLPKEVVQERFERLLALQERISEEEADQQIGRTLEVLVAEGSGKKDGAARRLSGRAPDNRLVHFALPVVPDEEGVTGSSPVAHLPSEPESLDDPRLRDTADLPAHLPRPGDMVTVTVTQAAPHFLVSDSAIRPDSGFAVRRTRSGDAWAAREQARLGGGDDHHSHGPAPAAGTPVTLGMPTIGPR